MTLSPELREQLDETIASDDVVLFMKGNRRFPQCGFSATVTQILDQYVPEYTTVNVLAEPAIREGIKVYSSWPTIPQLYIRGEFIGGCDIVREMNDNGDLQTTLGIELPPVSPPDITITDAAVEAFQQGPQPEADQGYFLQIDPQFKTDMGIIDQDESLISVTVGAMTWLMDRGTAQRANGLTMDFVTTDGGGFRLDNPNEPPRVREIPATEVKKRMDADPELRLFDVRGPNEQALARIGDTPLLDQKLADEILTLDRSTPLYFHCHHGMRSREAADWFLKQGFTEVYNMHGGINSWSADVDPNVPQY